MCRESIGSVLIEPTTLALVIGFTAIAYGMARNYEKHLGIGDGTSRPKAKTVFILSIVLVVPLVLFMLWGECSSDFFELLALIGIPIWFIGWLIWFGRRYRRYLSRH